MSEKQFERLDKRLTHIESLLQRMPEIIAAAYLIEKENADCAHRQGKEYSETIELAKSNQR